MGSRPRRTVGALAALGEPGMAWALTIVPAPNCLSAASLTAPRGTLHGNTLSPCGLVLLLPIQGFILTTPFKCPFPPGWGQTLELWARGPPPAAPKLFPGTPSSPRNRVPRGSLVGFSWFKSDVRAGRGRGRGLSQNTASPPQGVPSTHTHLAIQSKQEKHNKKENGPKRGQRHHGHSFGVCNEGQART